MLEPEQAFKFSASAASPGQIEVRYQIADGYYLYREKFKFASDTANVKLGKASFPAGKIKEDEYFGKVETYRKHIVIKLPVELPPGADRTVTLKVTSQGCADAGVCYPPLTQTAKITLPAEKSAPAASGGLSALNALAGLGASGNEFLEPDQAFKLEVSAKDAQTLRARFSIADSYYLYRERIKFSLRDAKGVSIAKVELPKGETKTDPNFGVSEVYHHPFEALIHLDGSAQQIVLDASYQGCSEKGVCYPPIRKTVTLSLSGSALPSADLAADLPHPPNNPLPRLRRGAVRRANKRPHPELKTCSKAVDSGWSWRASLVLACCWR